MTHSTTANSKISIGTTAAATDATSFAADTYVEIGNVEDLGEAGSSAPIVEGRYIGREYVRKLKGQRDNGTMTIVVARDPEDAGQTAMRAAEKTSFSYNVKVELNDKPNATGTNTIFYFKALVASARNSFAGVDDIVKTTFELAIDGAILEVPATAGE